MSYCESWHRDFAAEGIKGAELNRWAADANMNWTEFAVECGDVARLALGIAREIGNGNIAAIAQTVLDTIAASAAGGNARNRSRRAVTPAQRRILAVVLLEKYTSARAIAVVIWGLTDEEINGADA
jgi:hypothetical protein